MEQQTKNPKRNIFGAWDKSELWLGLLYIFGVTYSKEKPQFYNVESSNANNKEQGAVVGDEVA